MEIKIRFQKWGDEWEMLERTDFKALFRRRGQTGERYNVIGIRTAQKDYKFPSGQTISKGQEMLDLGDAHWGRTSWEFHGDLFRAQAKLRGDGK